MAVTINASTSNGLVQTADTSGNINIQSNGTTVLTAGATGVIIPAGTTTIAPLQLTSGTNLTTATAGAVEYNGYSPYFTPTGTQRGIIQAQQYYRLNSGVAGTTATTAQSIFGVGVTLASSTQYEFQIYSAFVRPSGTTSHNFTLSFGGTATINNIVYGYSSFVGSGTGLVPVFIQTASYVVQSGITTDLNVLICLSGTVSINSGGTFIPQYTLSANPGSAYTTQIGSYFKIAPLAASGANVNIGTWA